MQWMDSLIGYTHSVTYCCHLLPHLPKFTNNFVKKRYIIFGHNVFLTQLAIAFSTSLSNSVMLLSFFYLLRVFKHIFKGDCCSIYLFIFSCPAVIILPPGFFCHPASAPRLTDGVLSLEGQALSDGLPRRALTQNHSARGNDRC